MLAELCGNDCYAVAIMIMLFKQWLILHSQASRPEEPRF